MSTVASLLLVVVVMNPARVRLRLGSRSSAVRVKAAREGALLTCACVIGLAAASGPLLDAFEVAPETFQIAAAMVIIAAGIVTFALPPRRSESLASARAAFVPVAYPILLSPAVVLLTISIGSTQGVLFAFGCLVTSLVLVIGAARPQRIGPGMWAAAARLTSAASVVLSVALLIDGLRTI
jgi:small neutral amino acid transporter SnatA (MarC family)